MKHYISILMIILLAGKFVYSQQNDNWKWLNPKPQGNSLFAVDFINDDLGYAAGFYGTILKTSDAGNNWDQLVSGTNENLLSIEFIDANTGFAGGNNQLLLKTVNGGINWTPVVLPSDPDYYIMDIEFVNQNTGFVLGFFQLENRIWKTTDGGNTWATYATGDGYWLKKLYFLDELNGYGVGGSLGSQIVKTTDGGESWFTVEYFEHSSLNTIVFLNPIYGLAAGEDGHVLLSTNAGMNWTQVGSPTSMEITSLNFIDGNTGFGIGTGTIYVKTTDGGLSWTEEQMGINFAGSYMDGTITPNGTIHSVGTFGVMLKSTNAGNDWITQYTVTEKTITEIQFMNSNTGYAVCGYGAGDILKTTNAGETWFSQVTQYTLPQYGIAVTDDQTVYLAGSINVKKTTNGGANWIDVYTSTQNEIFTDVAFTDQNTGYVVGSYGKFLKTTNAGVNWTSFTANLGGTIITSIDFVDQNIVYAVGDDGAIGKSFDAGQNWIIQSSPFKFGYFTSVNFVDANTGYISAGEGILRTTNGGTNWEAMNTPDGGYYKVQFRGGFGYAVSSDGKIIKSTDAGTSWIEQPTVTNNGLYGLYFNIDNYVYAGGSIGTMLKTIPTELIVTGITNTVNQLPESMELYQNYPNPFNPTTNIEFSITKPGFASLKVYNAAGKEVSTIVNNNLNAGTYKFRFDASSLSSGIYFYTLNIGNSIATKKMLLIK